MLDTEQIKIIISKSLQKFAQEDNVAFDQVQMRIVPTENLVPAYQLFIGPFDKAEIKFPNYQRDIHFLSEVADIPYTALDFMGTGEINNEYMRKAFSRYTKKHNITPENISLVIFSLKADVVDAVIGLYNHATYVAQIKFDEIFNQQNLITSE